MTYQYIQFLLNLLIKFIKNVKIVSIFIYMYILRYRLFYVKNIY
jgi:hypothetical protein